jgi:hypothetical protein
MVATVRTLSADPLSPSSAATTTAIAPFETSLIADAIHKFSRLLQLALGDAGAGILGHNLSAQERVDVMLPGRFYFSF